MPNTYTLKVDTSGSPPRATLVNEDGIAVAATEILASSTESEVRDWAEATAAKHEAELAQKQAENAAAAAKAETLKTALENTEITV